MGRRRVFVTGMGIFSPLGGEIKEFWDNLSHGQSGVHQITKFDPTPSMNTVAGIIQNYNSKLHVKLIPLKIEPQNYTSKLYSKIIPLKI